MYNKRIDIYKGAAKYKKRLALYTCARAVSSVRVKGTGFGAARGRKEREITDSDKSGPGKFRQITAVIGRRARGSLPLEFP